MALHEGVCSCYGGVFSYDIDVVVEYLVSLVKRPTSFGGFTIGNFKDVGVGFGGGGGGTGSHCTFKKRLILRPFWAWEADIRTCVCGMC